MYSFLMMLILVFVDRATWRKDGDPCAATKRMYWTLDQYLLIFFNFHYPAVMFVSTFSFAVLLRRIKRKSRCYKIPLCTSTRHQQTLFIHSKIGKCSNISNVVTFWSSHWFMVHGIFSVHLNYKWKYAIEFRSQRTKINTYFYSIENGLFHWPDVCTWFQQLTIGIHSYMNNEQQDETVHGIHDLHKE